MRGLDVAKALLEEGFHAPTVYFPLIVDEALMFEPTETESLQTLEALAQAIETHRPARGGRPRRAAQRAPAHPGVAGRRGPCRSPPHRHRGRQEVTRRVTRPGVLTLADNVSSAVRKD